MSISLRLVRWAQYSTDQSLPELKAKVICGIANNQLAEPRHGKELSDRGITYVPDYVANAGGMMGAGSRIFSQPSDEETRKRILGLYDTVTKILDRAHNGGVPTSEIADQMARERIAGGPHKTK